MNEQIDSSIPVLTEIIHPGQSAINPSTAAPAKATSSSTTADVAIAQTKPLAIKVEMPASNQEKVKDTVSSEEKADAEAESNISNEAWLLLERSLHEKVLKQVLSRVEFVLEHRVRDSLADVLQGAVDTLAEDIRVGLKNSLEEVISRAVAQELAKAKLHR
jgi:hypothetical protein